MNKNLKAVLFAVSAIAFSASVHADSVVAVYTCELEDGKEQEDVQALNAKWLKWVKANVSEEVESAVGSPIVGTQNIFLFADTYPDLNTWAAVQTALDSDAADELDNLFDDTAECTESRLWKFEPTE